eukprot:TRINITY_DN300_c0_g1_i2.p2 TRINITY_DN300_c0_g1~~TRINITY_DN300_c0_g1_i2.p2  ORF type:complete len:104 (+),score=1.58 TRINITY_DN300_c0_g1_i2:792-1103(+)
MRAEHPFAEHSHSTSFSFILPLQKKQYISLFIFIFLSLLKEQRKKKIKKKRGKKRIKEKILFVYQHLFFLSFFYLPRKSSVFFTFSIQPLVMEIRGFIILARS